MKTFWRIVGIVFITTMIAVSASAQKIVLPNNPQSGTVLNELAVLTAGGTVRVTNTSDNTFTGIVIEGAGFGGNATLVQTGQAACVFDGPASGLDYAVISTTVDGNCHDSGTATNPGGSNVVGIITSANANGTFNVVFSVFYGSQKQHYVEYYITGGPTPLVAPSWADANTLEIIELLGAGGGGASSSGANFASSGGSAGALCTLIGTGLFTAGQVATVTVGSGGAGAPNNTGDKPGSNGGATTMTLGGTTYTAGGGVGGIAGAATGSTQTLGGVSSGCNSTLAYSGNTGWGAGRASASLEIAYGGHALPYGTGGTVKVTSGGAPGGAASGFGSGGAAGVFISGAIQAGAAGQPGLIHAIFTKATEYAEYYLTSGSTWQAPSWANGNSLLHIYLFGGGGGGGGNNSTSNSGVGGGAAGICTFSGTGVLAASATYNISIGAAGAGSTTDANSGGVGGTTTFELANGTFLTSNGGVGGAPQTQTGLAAGGTASNCTLNINGAYGWSWGLGINDELSGGGMNPPWGIGGVTAYNGTGTSAVAATGCGAGGSGPAAKTSQLGASGSAGCIHIIVAGPS